MRAGRALMILAVLAACGPSEQGSGPATSRKAGSDDVARACVAAFLNADCAAVAACSSGNMKLYFETLVGMKQILLEVIAAYEEMYPAERESETLSRLRAAWRKPMTFYHDLALDGSLKDGRTEETRRYRISWQGDAGERLEDVMVVSRTKNDWRVTSIGQHTPGTDMLAAIRTQYNELRFTYKKGLDMVRRRKPANVAQAHTMFSVVRQQMIKGK